MTRGGAGNGQVACAHPHPGSVVYLDTVCSASQWTVVSGGPVVVVVVELQINLS